MENLWLIGSIWIAIALAASVISIRLGVSVALVEITLGAAVGNLWPIPSTEWTDFLAKFGAVLLTFLAGAEIDHASLRADLKASLLIGLIAFLAPFLGVSALAFWGLHWNTSEALIAGIALSTTSVAVVYAVLLENGLNRTRLGKLILAACFVNDLGTVLALGACFAAFGLRMLLFAVATLICLYHLPVWTSAILEKVGRARVSEPEAKFLLLVLFALGGLAAAANSEAVLPAYLVGLVTAEVLRSEDRLMARLRSIAFGVLTPFYFIKAGLLISAPALLPAAGLVALLLGAKLLTKFVGVWPVARACGFPLRERNYMTLLMSTGLTFGTISALFGLETGIISQSQYSVLVTVVVLSAVAPTLIAERFFRPGEEPESAQPGEPEMAAGSV
jgi:Kef-type K+ transport system membrane component KefB